MSTNQEDTVTSVTDFINKAVFDLTLELARGLASKNIAQEDSAAIARDTIDTLATQNRGLVFCFQKRNRKKFYAALSEALARNGLRDGSFHSIAGSVVDDLFFNYQNQNIYFRKINRNAIIDRDKAIAKEYRKNPGFATVKAMAHKYNLSQPRVYVIIRNNIDWDGSGRKYPPKAKPRGVDNNKRSADIVSRYLEDPGPHTVLRLANQYRLGVNTIHSILWRAKVQP